MRRGDVVIVAAAGDYGKPRPAVIVQTDAFPIGHPSAIICRMTSELADAPDFRVTIAPHPGNGLRERSQIMVDQPVTVRRERIGQIRQADLSRSRETRCRRGLQGGRPGGVPMTLSNVATGPCWPAATGLAQAALAARYGIPPGSLRDWEQGRRAPDAAALSYLRVIARMPEAVAKALHDAAGRRGTTLDCFVGYAFSQ